MRGGTNPLDREARSSPASSQRHSSYVGRLTGTWLRNATNTVLNTHQYTYNYASQRARQTRLAGDYVDYSYDGAGQLKTAVGKESGGGTSRALEQFGYAYDAGGNLQYRTNNALVQTFSVDNVNELTGVSRSGTLTVAGGTTGPATSVTVNGQTATRYGDNTFARAGFTLTAGPDTFTAVAADAHRSDTNAVMVTLPASVSYTYDDNGNLTGDGQRTFEYDAENQLAAVTVSNAWRSEFKYDGKLRRRVRTEKVWTGSAFVTANETRYVYDGMLVVQERDANNVPAVTYTRGRDLSGSLEGAGGIGGLLARTSNSSLLTSDFSGAHAYYHADGNGNITALANGLGTVVARYLYGPYGNLLAKAGSLADANLYRFSSKEFHANSGLYYYGYRYYEPALQRWLNRDPLGELDESNLFEILSNDPATLVDPFGLQGGIPPGSPPGTLPFPGPRELEVPGSLHNINEEMNHGEVCPEKSWIDELIQDLIKRILFIHDPPSTSEQISWDMRYGPYSSHYPRPSTPIIYPARPPDRPTSKPSQRCAAVPECTVNVTNGLTVAQLYTLPGSRGRNNAPPSKPYLPHVFQ